LRDKSCHSLRGLSIFWALDLDPWKPEQPSTADIEILVSRNQFLAARKLFLVARNTFLATHMAFMRQIKGNLQPSRPYWISGAKK
jgi:hypothetical protein